LGARPGSKVRSLKVGMTTRSNSDKNKIDAEYKVAIEGGKGIQIPTANIPYASTPVPPKGRI